MANELRVRVRSKMVEVLTPTKPNGMEIDSLQDEVVKSMNTDPKGDVEREVFFLANSPKEKKTFTMTSAIVRLTVWNVLA